MTRKELLTFVKQQSDKLIATLEAKNTDYAGGDDPWGNLASAEPQDICTNETAFLVRINDKWSRLKSFVKNGQLLVKDESVEDTLQDLAGYCLLMQAYIKSKKTKEKKGIEK